MTTPSQTVGPFYAIGLCRRTENELVSATDAAAIRLTGRLLDGDGQPVPDGMIEIWDATARRWGRSGTGQEGTFSFVVAKPTATATDAPHLDVLVFARGLLKHQRTRMYFPDQAANASDRVLSALSEADRARLVAEDDDDGLRFDVHLQGEHETVFFST